MTQSELPPSDMVAERAVLRACFAGDAMNYVADQVDAEDFYSESNKWTFHAMRDCWARSQRVNSITVRARLVELGRNGVLSDTTLEDIMQVTDARKRDDVIACAVRVRQLAHDRDLLWKLQKAAAVLRHGVADRDAFYGDLEGALHKAQEARGEEDSVSFKEALAAAFQQMRDAKPGQLKGVSCGFRALDEILCGLVLGDLSVLAGRPGMCKTAVGAQIATAVAKAGVGTVFYSMEMGAPELGGRMLASDAHVDGRAPWREGGWGQEEFRRVMASATELSRLALRIDTRPLTIAGLRIRAKREAARFKAAGLRLGLVVIDYFQLLRATSSDPDNEALRLERAIQEAKYLAAELNVHVIALSQLNREVEKGKGRRPNNSDLRGSGGIEQAANNILFIHRQDRDLRNLEEEVVEVIVSKQRNGPTGTALLALHRASTQFRDATDDEQEQYLSRSDIG